LEQQPDSMSAGTTTINDKRDGVRATEISL
jgi:hypothetical protein